MKRRLIVYLVAFAAFLGPFTQTIYTPILPEVLRAYQTTFFLVNASISIFTFTLALMQIIYGPLTDTKGRRKVLLAGLAIYVAASLGCSFAPSIGILLVFRALQAVGIAAGTVVAVTVIGDLFEGPERGRMMGVFQTMVSLGPVLGPVIGGFLGGITDFHHVFLVLVCTGLLVFGLNFYYLRETKSSDAASDRFEPKHFATIFSSPVGLSMSVIGFIQFYSMYCFLVFLPDLLTKVYGLSAEQKGLVFLPLSFFIVIGSTIGGRVQEHVRRGTLLTFCLSLDALAILCFVLLAKDSLFLLIASIAMFGLFLGISLPVQTTLLTMTFKKNRASAVGVYNFCRYMGMAAGPMFGSVLAHAGGLVSVFGFGIAMFVCGVILLRLLAFRKQAAYEK